MRRPHLFRVNRKSRSSTGEARRKIVHDALTAIDEQVKPKLAAKKYVVIKPNGLAAENPLELLPIPTLCAGFSIT